MIKVSTYPIFNTIITVFSYIALNLLLMLIIGYLTIDSEANTNSQIGAYLLSFFIPYFIASRTLEMPSKERVLKFGSGFILFILLSFIFAGIPSSFNCGLVPCLLISTFILYIGDKLFE